MFMGIDRYQSGRIQPARLRRIGSIWFRWRECVLVDLSIMPARKMTALTQCNEIIWIVVVRISIPMMDIDAVNLVTRSATAGTPPAFR
jgi:hypothetical protein